MENPIRVLLADDHPVTSEGVVALLESCDDITVVGRALNGAELLSMFAALSPDVVVTDQRMPILDGVAATRALTATNPDAKILVFSYHDGEEQVYQALQAGARGYLTKDRGIGELIDAIRTIASGKRYLPVELAEKYAQRVMRPNLTARELETLKLVALGLSNREVASQLGIAERTAALHVGNLLAKLGAKTRAEAVALAASTGLIGS